MEQKVQPLEIEQMFQPSEKQDDFHLHAEFFSWGGEGVLPKNGPSGLFGGSPLNCVRKPLRLLFCRRIFRVFFHSFVTKQTADEFAGHCYLTKQNPGKEELKASKTSVTDE